MQPEAKAADFQVGPHEPEWLVIGNAAICVRCGWVSFNEEEIPAVSKQFVVSDSKGVAVGQQCPVLGEFEFISGLPEPETGRYNLDDIAGEWRS